MAGVLDAVPYDGSPVIKDSKNLPLMPKLSPYQWSEQGEADSTSAICIIQSGKDAGIDEPYLCFLKSIRMVQPKNPKWSQLAFPVLLQISRTRERS